jgi:hypothetical protein
MTMQRYWVVGGDYDCVDFKSLRNGRPDVMGPFESREAATTAWRRISEETRSCATARYAIAAEQIVLPN